MSYCNRCNRFFHCVPGEEDEHECWINERDHAVSYCKGCDRYFRTPPGEEGDHACPSCLGSRRGWSEEDLDRADHLRREAKERELLADRREYENDAARQAGEMPIASNKTHLHYRKGP
jgi:hypothetical protein